MTDELKTLRDEFAMAALSSFMANKQWVKGMDAACYKDGMKFKDYLAREMYTMADAMLEARKR